MKIKNYSVDTSKKWDYENGFYLTCETGRIGKFLNHLEVYKKILSVEGDILEFGVYKGTSLVRFISFRDLLETPFKRKVFGFDAFGKFPSDLSLQSDLSFVKNFEKSGGFGISKAELEKHLKNKKAENIELVEGNIMETLPVFLKDNPDLKISLLHIDVDVYEPTKLILETLWNKISKGGVLVLDDYNTVEGETRAVKEFFKDNNTIVIQSSPYYHIPSFIIKP